MSRNEGIKEAFSFDDRTEKSNRSWSDDFSKPRYEYVISPPKNLTGALFSKFHKWPMNHNDEKVRKKGISSLFLWSLTFVFFPRL